jgi:S1-C subfamily serine protease
MPHAPIRMSLPAAALALLVLVTAARHASPAVAARDQWAPVGGPFATAARAAHAGVVKIHGAGIGRARGYGSGVLVSSDGLVVTVLSALLEGDAPRVVLSDGRGMVARVVARDELRQLALLKVDATDLPYFEPASSAHVRPGDWVIAAANPFKVAEGPEAVSVAVGTLSAVARLDARRRAQDFPYEGEVLMVDVVVATPGSAGGALLDLDGRLVGLIGKMVASRQTNTWVNYALPVEAVSDFLAEVREGRLDQRRPVSRTPEATAPAVDLGIRLFNLGGRVRPAYVERVRAGSSAAVAGVQPDDLVLSLDRRPVATCDEYDAVLRSLRRGATVELVVKRGDELLTLRLDAGTEP